jgi:hypothetical protein
MPDFRPFLGVSQEDTAQHILLRLIQLVDSIGVLSPDSVGRLRVVD